MCKNVLILVLVALLLGGGLMARGSPDYGVGDYVISQTNFDTTDVIATTLNFGRLDSMGRIMFVDTFEHGNANWSEYTVGSGSDPVVLVEPAKGFVSGAAVDLAVSALGDESGIRRGFILPSTKKIGVETAFQTEGVNAYFHLQIDHQYVNGESRRADLRWGPDQQVLEIYSGGAWHVVPTPYDLAMSAGFWLQVKLVLNWEAVTYDRLMVGAYRADISNYSLFAYGGGQTPFDRIDISAKQDTGANKDHIQVGAIILTMDEP